jgi:hypothetical protein
MNTKKTKEATITNTHVFPKVLYERIQKTAKDQNKSVNKQIVAMLEDWYVKNIDDSMVKLEPTTKKAITMFAEKNGFTITEATNYLVATRINVYEWVHDLMIEEANKANRAYEAQAWDDKKESAI